MFDLLTNVIEDTTPFYSYESIECIRTELLQSKKTINRSDYGTGALKGKSRKQKVKHIAKNAAKSAKYGQLLFRLVNHFQPATILELGTSLGISTLYLATPNKKSKVLTLEGCPETAAIAKQNFEKENLKNIELVIGNFDATLPEILKAIETIDCVFFDGNHQQEPTLSYFEQCLLHINENTLFIFDDIHWSDEMEEAWTSIKNYPQVTLSIDLFFVGLVFFRKQRAQEHFVIRF